ncbi:MAG: hypothetical protein R8P61_30755 [Bacteroidia bacterium]|nr:hypothetical protein [Bacteroidia bacterium]
MRKHSFMLILLLSFLSASFSQSELELLNSQKIDPDRYEDIEDSPYLFKNWLIGNVTTNSGEIIKEVFINYNGYSKNFEVKKGDRFIELEDKFYMQIELDRKKNGDKFPKYAGENLIFQRSLHKQFKEKFVRLVYRGKQVSVIEKYRVTVTEKTFQDVGRTITKKRFIGTRVYYLLKDGELKNFSMKRSSVIKNFGLKKELDQFMRKQKINLDKDEDISKVFAYYEELLSSQ